MRYLSLALALVLLSTLLVGLVALRTVYNLTNASTQERLMEGEAAFRSFTQYREGELEALALLLREEPTLLTSVLAGQRRDDSNLVNLLSIGGADFVGMRTTGGEIRIVPEELGLLIASAIEELASVPGAGAGTGYSDVSWAADGTLLGSTQLALADGGRVFAGYYMGHAFTEQFAALAGLDLTLFSKGTPVATSLRGQDGAQALDVVHSSAALPGAQGEGSATAGSFSIGTGSFDAHYFPLYDRRGRLLGAYATSLPVPKPLAPGFSVNHWSAFVLFALLISVAVGSASLLTRRIVVPLRALRVAASRIGQGDLATPIAAETSVELRPLAREIEAMRGSLLSAHSQLAIEKSLYQGTFHAMADGVFTTDESGTVTSANPAFITTLDGRQASGRGGPCCGTTVLTDREGRSLCAVACTWLWFQGQSEPVVVKGRLEASGQTADIEMTVTPIKDDGQRTVGLVHVVRDISAQEQLQRLKERFLMSVSHELRTPLAALMSSVEFLKDDFLRLPPEDRGRLLETVHRGTVRLQTLTTNLLDLGSIQAGCFTVTPEPLSLVEPLEEALAASEAALAGKGQRTEVHIPPNLPLVRADPVRIVQVLTNLVANASKYGPAEDTIVVSVAEEREKVRVAVTDHGAGIDPEEKQRLFEYFYRGLAASRAETGYGIGLAITRGIIQAHRGEVGVISEAGEGASFWFTLPKDL